MKKGIRTALPVLFALLFCLILSAAAAGEKKPAGLTVMVYMCGSDLESSYASATRDIEEMIGSGAGGPEVSILVLAGGTSGWASGYAPDELTTVEISRGRSRVVARSVLRSMGDPETLRGLIAFAEENYPADRYALIFWDHGNGPMEGLCFDELYRPDRLSVEEIAGVLKDRGFSGRKLAWIGFDACLMGSVEVAAQLAPYAEYMIASEENEPACGWDYSFLRGIEQDASVPETAKRLIDLYVAQDVKDVMTLSCLDLSKTGMLIEAVDGAFARAAAITDAAGYSEVSRLRKQILSYGSDVSRGMLDHDLVDAGQLMNSIPGLDAEDVRLFYQAAEQAVVCRNSNIRGDSGVSVYFPFYNKEMYDDWIGRYPLAGVSEGYTDYIGHFGGMLTDRPFADWSGLKLEIYLADQKKSVPSPYALESLTNLGTLGDAGYIGSLTPEEAAVGSGILARTGLTEDQRRDFLSARLLVLERFHTMFSEKSQYRVIYSSPELELSGDGFVRGVYPELTLHVVDENGVSVASEVSYSYRENGDLAVQAVARDAFPGEEGREIPVIMTFRPDEAGRLMPRETFVFDELTGGYTNRAGCDPEKYPYLIFPYQYIVPASDENGSRLDSVRWEESEAYNRETAVANDGKWHLEFRDASGRYALALCMEITDTQNNRHISTIRTVDWGYGSRDMIYEHPNLRVIAENVYADSERVSLSMTLISSEYADFELAVYDASVNGVPAGIAGPSGEPAACSEIIRLPEGRAFTRTVSFVPGSPEPPSEISFRLAVYYDESSEAEIRTLENGRNFISLIEEEDRAPAGAGHLWYFTGKIRVRLSPEREIRGGVFSTDETTVLGGHMHYKYPYHWAVLGGASPLKPELSGETRYYRVLPDIPEIPENPENPENPAAGEKRILYLGETRAEGGKTVMDVRQKSLARTDGSLPLSFLISEKDFLLGSGAEARPATLELGEGRAVLDGIRISGEESAEPHRIRAEIGESRVKRVQWTFGDAPAETARKAEWNSLRAEWTEDGKLTVTEVPRAAALAPGLLTARTEEPPAAGRTAVITDRNGTILKVCPAEELIREEAGRAPDGITTVLQTDPREGTEETFFQSDEWIWKNKDLGAAIVRYIGKGPSAVVPEQARGRRIVSLETGALAETDAYDVELPSYGVGMEPSTFAENPDRRKTEPDRGTLTVHVPEELSAEMRTEVHTKLGFARCVTPAGESFWEPPLIYRRTPENGLEVIGRSGTEESAEIPAAAGGLPVTAVGSRAFAGTGFRTQLKSVVLPEGITRIGDFAFQGSAIGEITLPASLKELGTGVLDSCSRLRKVRIRCSPDLIGADFFAGCVLLRHNPSGITLPADATDEEIAAFTERVFPGLDRPLRRENEQEDRGT